MSSASATAVSAEPHPPPSPGARSALRTAPGATGPLSLLVASPHITVKPELGVAAISHPVAWLPSETRATSSYSPHGPPGGRNAATTHWSSPLLGQPRAIAAAALPSGATATRWFWPEGSDSPGPQVSLPGGLRNDVPVPSSVATSRTLPSAFASSAVMPGQQPMPVIRAGSLQPPPAGRRAQRSGYPASVSTRSPSQAATNWPFGCTVTRG